MSFWETAQQAVASFHTLRMKRARDRLLEAEPWDLVIVDEAHHFQAQERATTQTYGLLRALEDARKISSLVLFTGTPHRGKDYGFLALMQLVRPDLFDPEKEMRDQLSDLHKAMIRNNKALATDLQGNKLFHPTSTDSVNYGYSPAEAEFYETMSEFILDGRAYANTHGSRRHVIDGRGDRVRRIVRHRRRAIRAPPVLSLCEHPASQHGRFGHWGLPPARWQGATSDLGVGRNCCSDHHALSGDVQNASSPGIHQAGPDRVAPPHRPPDLRSQGP